MTKERTESDAQRLKKKEEERTERESKDSSTEDNWTFGCSKEEIRRYSRQIIVPGVGSVGQQCLGMSSVAVVGLGGLGSPVALYLAAAGVAELGLFDFDIVEIHNLHRQILYSQQDIGRYKAEAAFERCKALNNTVKLYYSTDKLTPDNLDHHLNRYKIIADCTDSASLRYALSGWAKKQQKTLVCASVLGWEGQVYVLPRGEPCMRCVFGNPKRFTNGCDQRGVIGGMCGVVGAVQAVEVFKEIIKAKSESLPCLILIRGLTRTQQIINLAKTCKETCKNETNKNTDELESTGEGTANPPPKLISWKEALSSPFTILDIRSSYHFEMIHCKTAINFPFNEADSFIPKEFAESLKGKRIAVVCYRGCSAVKMAQLLLREGVEAVVVAGGVLRWMVEHGL